MSGESWKKMSVNYKDSKQPDIEEPREKYLKKKQKKNNRSKHKHKYVPAVYHLNFNLNGDKKQEHITCGSHCKYCGRINDMKFIWSHEEEHIEQFKKQYPDYIEIILPQGWDCFKDKNIPIN